MTPVLLLGLLLSPRERLARIATEYGVEIHVADRVERASRDSYTVTSEPVSPAVLDGYVPLFEAAWRRYPVSLMRRLGLRRIVIGSRVTVMGSPRAAVPEIERGWYWLDAAVGARNPVYGRRTLHHDLFHIIDEKMRPGADADVEWKALNPKGFRYGIGGWWMQRSGVGDLRTDLPGFLTAYSTAAPIEDKAEVFSHLVCDLKFVLSRVLVDPVLKAKVALLESRVVAFEPAMSAEWWETAVAD